MAGSWRFAFGMLASFALMVPAANAFGGRFGFWSGGASSSYAAPAYSSGYGAVPYYYCPPAPKIVPVPDARPGFPFAIPTPAPPSSTGAPPIRKNTTMPPAKTSNDPRMPIITPSKGVEGSYSPGTAPLAKGRCRVGFWNLSGRDVTVVIDGKTWKLAKNRSLTLDLEHQFAWQVAGRPQHVERLPTTQASHEIVIRE